MQPATLAAWNAYVANADAQVRRRIDPGRPSLWTDDSPERAASVRGGEVIVAPAVARGTQSVPGGLVHHWIGAVFIPNATIQTLWAVVHDYDR